jgi:subtilisin family serine protease
MKRTLLSLAILAAFNVQAQNTIPEFKNDATYVNLNQTGATTAWMRNTTGKGSVIGIIDQGFDITHTDISKKIIAYKNFASTGVSWGFHGTAMASIAAGALNNSATVGVAPDARLLLARAGAGGTNLSLDVTAVKNSLDWLSANRATVINLSFGYSYDSDFINAVRYDSATKTFINPGIANNIADYKLATDRGSIIVAAAGNQGLPYSQAPAVFASRTNANGTLVLSGRAIIVGAVDSNNQITGYSNQAGHLCFNRVNLTCKDTVRTMDYYVVAPGMLEAATANQLGKGINTSGPVSGTSGAAAYVSGGVALIRQAWPQLKPEQLVTLLLTTTKDLGAPGTDEIYGRGLVDLERATRPIGTIKLASSGQILTGTNTSSGPAIAGSAVIGGGGMIRSLTTSSVLSNTQAVDNIGRNYSVNLTKALLAAPVVMNPRNPYLGYMGSQSLDLILDHDRSLRLLPGTNGVGIQLDQKYGPLTLEYQTGHISETSGFLGNYGQGVLSLGSSSTVFAQIGTRLSVREGTDLFVNYAQGNTTMNQDAVSVIKLSNTVQTQSWRLGVAQSNLFRPRDQLAFSIGTPVQIRRGSAEVTAVTGYEYQTLDNGDVNASPIVSKETLNLKSATEYAIGINYHMPVTKHSMLALQFSHSSAGYGSGINFVARY